jgi:hypothetical protein
MNMQQHEPPASDFCPMMGVRGLCMAVHICFHNWMSTPGNEVRARKHRIADLFLFYFYKKSLQWHLQSLNFLFLSKLWES